MDEPKAVTEPTFSTEKLVLGLLLVGVGVLAFIDAIDIAHPRTWWRLWPVAIILLGLASEFDALRARRSDGGSLLVGFGVWMLVGSYELFGLGYRTGMPLGFIVVGLFMALHAIVDKPQAQPQKKENYHEPC